MNDFETRLAGRLHDLATGETGTPPTQSLLVRGRQARHRRRIAVTGFATAVVVAAGAVTAAVSSASSPPLAEETAAVRLAAAVATSDNTSYRVKVRVGANITEGAFDPATQTGYLNSAAPGDGVVYQERLINGVRFVSSSGSRDVWKQYPDTHDRLAYDKALNSAASASAAPEALFEALTQAGAVITKSGAGFHFEVTIDGDLPVTLVGDVTVGADNRIAAVAYEETLHFEKNGHTEVSTESVTVELSEYGTPVTVEQPANVVVVK
jgi:hypothetical protein